MRPKCDPDRYTNLTDAPCISYGRLPRDPTPLEKSTAAPARSGNDQSFLFIGFGPGVGRSLAIQPKCDPDRYTNLTGAPCKGYGRLPRNPTPLKTSNTTPIHAGNDQSFLS